MTHNDASQSLVLLWTSDRPGAETETWQHTTLTGDRHPCTGGIRTRNPSKRAAADPHLVLRAQFNYGIRMEWLLLCGLTGVLEWVTSRWIHRAVRMKKTGNA